MLEQHFPSHLDAVWKPFSFSTSGDQSIVAGVAGTVIYVYSVVLSSASSTNVTFKDGGGTNFSGAMPVTSMALDLENKPMIVSKGNSFIINSSNAVAVGGMILVVQE